MLEIDGRRFGGGINLTDDFALLDPQVDVVRVLDNGRVVAFGLPLHCGQLGRDRADLICVLRDLSA